MKIAVVAVTEEGKRIGRQVRQNLPQTDLYLSKKLSRCEKAFSFHSSLKDISEELFVTYDGIIFCMALGIVIRVIASYIKDKHTDPAVVIVDDKARFAISALSGHEGGANALAIRVGNILGAEPIITTATESLKNMVIGIGCRRGIKKGGIIRAVKYALARVNGSLKNVRCIASIDRKQNEAGLREACMEMGIPLRIISGDMIKNYHGTYQRSSFVKQKIGVEGVSEPCALLAARKPKLILAKRKLKDVTVAIAEEG